MNKPFGYYGITNPNLLAVEEQILSLPPLERNFLAAELLTLQPGKYLSPEGKNVEVPSCTEEERIALCKAIVNSL